VTVPVDDASLDAASAKYQRAKRSSRRWLQQLEAQMARPQKKFEFEKAAQLRDRIRSFKQRMCGTVFTAATSAPAESAN